jgi:hypothetical protein
MMEEKENSHSILVVKYFVKQPVGIPKQEVVGGWN